MTINLSKDDLQNTHYSFLLSLFSYSYSNPNPFLYFHPYLLHYLGSLFLCISFHSEEVSVLLQDLVPSFPQNLGFGLELWEDLMEELF
jgi:hypothetical protein